MAKDCISILTCLILGNVTSRRSFEFILMLSSLNILYKTSQCPSITFIFKPPFPYQKTCYYANRFSFLHHTLSWLYNQFNRSAIFPINFDVCESRDANEIYSAWRYEAS